MDHDVSERLFDAFVSCLHKLPQERLEHLHLFTSQLLMDRMFAGVIREQNPQVDEENNCSQPSSPMNSVNTDETPEKYFDNRNAQLEKQDGRLIENNQQALLVYSELWKKHPIVRERCGLFSIEKQPRAYHNGVFPPPEIKVNLCHFEGIADHKNLDVCANLFVRGEEQESIAGYLSGRTHLALNENGLAKFSDLKINLASWSLRTDIHIGFSLHNRTTREKYGPVLMSEPFSVDLEVKRLQNSSK